MSRADDGMFFLVARVCRGFLVPPAVAYYSMEQYSMVRYNTVESGIVYGIVYDSR